MSRINILAVDDRKENLLFLESLFLDEAYNMLVTNSGKEALNIAVGKDIHLILLDVQMPGMDGYEVARLLRSDKRTEDIPIIFITAVNREIRHAIKGFEIGAVDYIFKPIVPDILKAKVFVFIHRYLKEKELAFKNRLLEKKNEELKEARNRLNEMNDSLEQKVKERTNELTVRNRELQRINEVLDNFMQISAHDLRGPLANLNLALQVFRKVEDEEERKKLLKGIDLSLFRIDQTIRGIVEMIEVQKGEKSMIRTVDFEDLISGIKQKFHLKIDRNFATIVTDFSRAPKIVYVESFLEKIMNNLISNALIYRSEKRDPVIEIFSIPVNQQVHLIVKDNGDGIDLEKHQKNLFKPFSRLDERNLDGKGIGLYLVKNMVEMNGGSVEVQSTTRKGTIFRLTLEPYVWSEAS